MLTCPIMFLSGFFRAFVLISGLLLFKMSVVKIDLQFLRFKTSELLVESVRPTYMPFSKAIV